MKSTLKDIRMKMIIKTGVILTASLLPSHSTMAQSAEAAYEKRMQRLSRGRYQETPRKTEKDTTGINAVPLSEAHSVYALVNGWKTYKDKLGYKIEFPKNISDDGTTATGIHYFDGIEITVEPTCVDKAAKLTDELKRWYNSTLQQISDEYYKIITRELTDNSFLIVKQDNEGSIYYDKCITGDRCLFKLNFYVDKANIKRLNEKDAKAVLALFTINGR